MKSTWSASSLSLLALSTLCLLSGGPLRAADPKPEFNANNAWALRDLLAQGDVKVLEFDRSFLKRFVDLSHAVVAEAGSGDELSKKIYASYQGFRAPMMDWIDIAERAFLNARGLG